MQMLKTKRGRFFELHVKYRNNPDNFSIQYNRKIINRKRVRRTKVRISIMTYVIETSFVVYFKIN